MKKIIVVLLAMVAMISFSSIVSAESSTSQLYIHYYRYAEDYTDWNVWVWQEEPSSLEGQGYDFETDDTALSDNFGGVVAKIDLDVSLPDATEVGLIVRKGNWAEKDIDANRYVEIPDTTESGIFHVYLVEGDQRIGTSIDDVDGPDKSPKFKTAYFVELDTIRYTATEELASTDITIYEDNIAKTPTSVTIDGNAGTIILPFELDFSKEYKIEAVFQDSSVNDFEITYDGIYDSEEFELAFAYTGDDLGAYPSDLKTTFRLWAPVSEQVVLNLYDTGTPLQFGGTDTPTKTVAMTPDIKGTFYHEEVGNLHGTYYTYSVTNGDMTSEVVDPYAKSTGINGLRGLIVDFDQVNPSGFTYDSRPDNMTNATDAIIYELHVRDLTTHSSWNGTEANRGKYLGLVESGTTFEGATTGFDHMVELGITHVQILPFFDFGVLDETKIDEEDYQPFNWGYMPLNFNALEGSYSADPYDGLERIKEMKEVVTAFTEAGIRVNMDVVYNHTGETANSNFNLIVPGYYHRKTANGAFANGSGTGNETASDRYMMQKFMVDSVVFWATEYNISGFRFDLMALHDVETMNLIATELKAIDQTIMVYGEPWKGFSESPLDSSLQAGKFNLDQMPDVGAFNDDLRDAVKGSVFLADEGGFVQGNNSSQIITRVKYGITGGVAFPGVSGSSLTAQKIWHTEPTKTINYVTAHDNNTLYDKLYQTLEEDGLLDLIPAMSKQANAIVLTSQGVAFLHAGDEILRSKPLAEGFDHNSYQSPDSVNQIRWNLKTTDTGEDVFEYYKGLIELRKSHPSFRMPTATEIIDNMAFLYEDKEGLIAYTIVNDDSLDAYDTILVAHNASDDEVKVRLPKDGGWVLIVDGDDAGTEQLSTYLGGSKLTITPHSSYVLYQDQSIEDYNPWPTIILS
ncbi:MAG: type I pullulanase, partial [Bacilli bacterium]|nr:type I pullulanase [Bacilli bacterium]